MRKVVFNALQTSLNGGIGRYSYELSKAIYNTKKVDYKIVVRKEDLQLFDFADKKDLIVAKGIYNSKDRNYYEQFVLPKLIYNRYPNTIIHYPDSMAPIFLKNKVIITVHDLAFRSIKGAFTWKSNAWKNIMTNLSVRKADKLIAITNFAKSEILKYYPNINKDKISVVYNGFNDFSNELINLDKVSNDIINVVKKPYILTVSTISPRKNIDGLIKAFNLIKDKIEYNLIIAGRNGWICENVYEIVDKLNLKHRVVFTGGVNDDELKILYKNAKLFVYPSFYEGFGLPPLEAMSFGVKCVLSNTTSIPEVVGEFASYFNPYSIEDMSEKLLQALMYFPINKTSNVNHILNKKFSWSKCANETVKVYLQCLNIER